MKVRLLKKYTPHSKELKKGTEMEVTNEKGRLWIEKGIAEEFKGLTKNEKQMNRTIKAEKNREAQSEADMIDSVDKKLDKKHK